MKHDEIAGNNNSPFKQPPSPNPSRLSEGSVMSYNGTDFDDFPSITRDSPLESEFLKLKMWDELPSPPQKTAESWASPSRNKVGEFLNDGILAGDISFPGPPPGFPADARMIITSDTGSHPPLVRMSSKGPEEMRVQALMQRHMQNSSSFYNPSTSSMIADQQDNVFHKPDIHVDTKHGLHSFPSLNSVTSMSPMTFEANLRKAVQPSASMDLHESPNGISQINKLSPNILPGGVIPMKPSNNPGNDAYAAAMQYAQQTALRHSMQPLQSNISNGPVRMDANAFGSIPYHNLNAIPNVRSSSPNSQYFGMSPPPMQSQRSPQMDYPTTLLHNVSGGTGNMYSPNRMVGAQPQPRTANDLIYQVQFKCIIRYYTAALNPSPVVGEFVVIEADRGEDLGIVTDIMTMPQFLQIRLNSHPERSRLDSDESVIGRILRVATLSERQSLTDKYRKEDVAKKYCEKLAYTVYKLPMFIHCAEFQFDKLKLVVYYSSDDRVDFREFVRDLFAVYKVRIWMKRIDPNKLNQLSSSASVALATGMQMPSNSFT